MDNGYQTYDDMMEEDTKRLLITPMLNRSGWDDNHIRMEVFTQGTVLFAGNEVFRDGNRKRADYVLKDDSDFVYAIVEAKKESLSPDAGIQQVKGYGMAMSVPFVYSTNGHAFVEYDFYTGIEKTIPMDQFPTPAQLKTRYLEEGGYSGSDAQLQAPYYEIGMKTARYYQRAAIKCVLEKIEKHGDNRVMLVMATGTGKTFTAMQILYKLYQAHPNSRMLYLSDRNDLVDDAKSREFKAFGNKMHKVSEGKVKSAYPLQFALYQNLYRPGRDRQDYEDYPPDFFQYIVVDECHRGSASKDSEWRKILEYFSPAVQIGMTATPKETEDIDGVSSSRYFGESVYTYSYKQGVEDGYLAPFRLIKNTIDMDEGWEPPSGALDANGNPLHPYYEGKDYDRIVIVEERTWLVAKYVSDYLRDHDPYMKTIVFCPTTRAAGTMRSAISSLMADYVRDNPDYCVRITGDDDEGRGKIEAFMDKDSKYPYPVVVTTSELLTTGYDGFVTELIVIDKPVTSPITLKQIIGRGSRLDTNKPYEKYYFTLIDFRDATQHLDGEWDMVPAPVDPSTPEPVPRGGNGSRPCRGPPASGPQLYQGHVGPNIVASQESTYGPGGMTTERFVDLERNRILEIYPDIGSFKKAWCSAERKKDVIEELERRNVHADELFRLMGDPGMDYFDMILKLVYSGKALTRVERADVARRSSELKRYEGVAREVLETIMDKYATTTEQDLSSIGVVKDPLFLKFGGTLPIVRAFGGKDEFFKALRTLQDVIYSAGEE